ncbi:MAG: nucleoside kinase [Spirochaetes bacterium]|nr:nucleoside kinase [Spirochaetota bacterium]
MKHPENIQIEIHNQKPIEIPSGTRVYQLIKHHPSKNYPYVAAMINNNVCSLNTVLTINAKVKFLTIESMTGMEVYRRSLAILLSKAIHVLFPKAKLIISHSIAHGFYYDLENIDLPIDKNILEKIKNQMLTFINEDIPIFEIELGYEEALNWLDSQKQKDEYNLLKAKNLEKVSFYQINHYQEMAFGTVVPRTGVLKAFDLSIYHPGFILRFPSPENPDKIATYQDFHNLFQTYRERKNWGRILAIHNVGALNDQITNKSIDDIVLIVEALQEKKLAEISDQINQQKEQLKLVLIAGPSSSGKTTFAKRLSVQFRVIGLNPINLSLDNYFIDREKTPRDAEGNYDFESLGALDIELFNQQLVELFSGQEVKLPSFNFKTGKRVYKGNTLKMDKGHILIIEGIHGLNEKLTYKVPLENKFKIFVSALSQIKLNSKNRISTTDTRLLRRMIRDSRFRGFTALQTLQLWPKVIAGEKKNITPFQAQTDAIFNSALDYEFGVIKQFALPLLKEIKPYHQQYYKAVHLISFLEYFKPIDDAIVPSNSILREFIGNSRFHY